MTADEKTIDFNIHNLAGIRLLGASGRDIETVERHLGQAPANFSGDAALTIRFVDRISVDEPVRFLGRDDVAFSSDAFILLRSHNLARARARLNMECIGQSFELICETGLPAIPLLRPLINMVMLARGIVPIHAAAFRCRNQGVLVTGWSHGSKTGTMLAFMAAGAQFVGDEWIYVPAGGDRMYGLPDQLEARSWYLRELPQFRRHVGFADRLRLWVAAGLASFSGPLASRAESRNSLTAKLIRQAHQGLLGQQSVHLRPLTLFGEEGCILSSPLNIVIVAVSHEADVITVTETPVDEVIARMTASFVHEQASLLSCYRKHLFAFPERRNPLLDQIELIYRRHAAEALTGKNTYTMRHPYPVSTESLRNAVEPLLVR